MLEDEVGTLREVYRNDYVTCSRCGRVDHIAVMQMTDGDALESPTGVEYLCSGCHGDIANGEQDLPADPD